MAVNKRTALEQAYLEREQLKTQNEGAPESTRVALSAISGRELLKTKAETAKIKRDRQIAEQQNQALLNKGAASAAITLEKTKASQALSLENRRKNEVLTMLGQGIYDPTFAGILGMQEGVVKNMADKKAAEIATRNAAAQSQAEYEAALQAINDVDETYSAGDTKHKEQVGAAIRQYNKDHPESSDLSAAKAKIVDAAVGNMKIPVDATKSGAISGFEKIRQSQSMETKAKNQTGFLGFLNKITFAVRDFLGDYQPNTKEREKAAVSAKKQETTIAKKDQRIIEAEKVHQQEKEAAGRYYDYAMTESIFNKDDDELTALEKAYKETPEGKSRLAWYAIGQASTEEEYVSAYENFIEQTANSCEMAGDNAQKAVDAAYNRYLNGEQLTEEEGAEIKRQKEEVAGMISVLNELAEADIFTDEQKDGINGTISDMEDIIEKLDRYVQYSEEYKEENYKYVALDRQYGELPVRDLEAKQKEINDYFVSTYGVSADAVEKSKIQLSHPQAGNTISYHEQMAEAKKVKAKQDPRYAEYLKLAQYIEHRKGQTENETADASAWAFASDYEGKSWSDKMLNAEKDTDQLMGEYSKTKSMIASGQIAQMYAAQNGNAIEVFNEAKNRGSLPIKAVKTDAGYSYYIVTSQGIIPADEAAQKELDRKNVAVFADGTPIEREKIVTLAEYEAKNENWKNIKGSLARSYQRNISDKAQAHFANETEMQASAQAFVDRFKVDDFKETAKKYRRGLEGLYSGYYDSFYEDVLGFVAGEYGYYEEADATLILALLGDGEEDTAFSHYANKKEEIVRKGAEDLGNWRIALGINSGPIRMLTHGGFMLKNAFTQSYARVENDIFSASHQVQLEEFSKNTGLGNDALSFLYQAGYTVMDMAPVVGLSVIPYVGQAASSAYLYAKSFATTYDGKIREGKRADEALTGAVLTAASEVFMERALSGIGKVGGSHSLSNTLSAAIDKLAATSGVQMALKLAGKAGSEGFEEFLQEVLSPFISKIAAEANGITGAEWEEIDWEEAGKSFLLGAFTGLGFGSVEVMNEFSSRNQQDVLSQRSLIGDGKDALKIIDIAESLGNKRAKVIKAAIQNKSPLYEGKQGLLAYASPADITNLRISIRRRSKRKVMQEIQETLQNDDKIVGVFKELLGNRSINLKQIELLLNDERAVEVLNKMTGENIAALMPGDAIYLARLAAFVDADGKVDKARLDAFRDAFGELDYKAIEQIFKYEDLIGAEIAKGNFSGVIYEDPAVEQSLKEEALDAVEGLKQLSEMTGTFYLVTDAFETGTYVANGVMTIKSEDLSKGAYYAMGKKAYYMMQQLDPDKGEVVKGFLMKEIEQRIGADGIEVEKKKLRQQGVDEAVLEDELCARMMPAVFLHGNFKAVEKLATLDPEAAEDLRKVIGSIREHLAEEYVDHAPEPEAVKGTGIVRFEEGVKATSRRQRLAVAYAKHIASAIGIDIVFYDSTIPGTFGYDANGYFFGKDNSIHLDLQKAEAGKGTVLFALSHELVHFAQKFSAEKYNTLADFLVENYGTDTMEQLIQNKMEQLKTDDRNLAKSEVIADACERMLIDSDAMVKLQALKEQDAGLWETIKEHLRKLMEKVRAMFAYVSPTTPEGIALQEMTDVLEQATAMFEDMVVDAAVTYQQTGGETFVDHNDIRYSIKTNNRFYFRELTEDEISGIVADIRYNKAERRKDLVQMGMLPSLYGRLFELSGDLFVSNSHLYNCIVSKETAIQEGRYISKDIGAGDDYHDLGEDTVTSAIKGFGDPLVIMESLKDYGEPRLISVLDEKGNDGKNLIAVLELYALKSAYGVGRDRNHVLFTIYEKNSLPNYIKKTVDSGRILYIKKGIAKDTQADLQLVGGVSKETLNNNIRKFNKKVKAFKEKNKINWQKKQNFSLTKTFSEAMADTVSQETTELYDRLTEALDKHYGIQRAVGADYDLSPDFDGTYFKYTDSNKGSAKQIEGENAELSRAELDGYLGSALDFGQEIAPEEKLNPAEMVSGEVAPKPSIFTKEGAKKTWNAWRRTWTDTGATVYDIAKAMNDQTLYHYYNAARSSTNAAIYMVMDKQVDICGNEIGKGLNEIFNPIRTKGLAYYNEFQLYLLHLHNVDRMSRRSQQAIEQAAEEFRIVVEAYPELQGYTDNEIRNLAKTASGDLAMMAQDYVAALNNKEYWGNIENLPIFGYDVTAEDSRIEAENLRRKHPEFKELAQDVYRYSDNLLQYRVDSGLITKDFADKLKEIYPHYVPTAREESLSKDAKSIHGISTDQVRIGKTIKRATGGDSKIIPLHKQFSDQTLAVVREGSKNRFGMRLLDIGDRISQIKKIENISDRMIPIVTFDGQINTVDPFRTEELQNIFTVYLNGEQYVMEVTPDLFEAVKALSPDKEETTILTELGRKSVDLYKKLITAYNPAFAIRNFARDMQDALFYTKDLRTFVENYLPAIREMKENGELWKKYCALGGTYSSIFNFDTGTINEQNAFEKKMARIEGLNMMIEQLPRFAEFMATVKKGNGSLENLMEAMYNAADITTNFGRSGKWGKFLNRTFVPFFNPGVQGFSKAVRAFTETRGVRPWMGLILKATFLGFAPALLNSILWGDEDDWEIINQREKDINYLFKVGDLWVKIPKGRVLSVLGMSADRIKQVIQGEKVEWGEFFTTVGDQIAPANPLTANVAAGIMSVGYNKTWYGGDIVSESMKNLPEAEQYDAQTDVISIGLGKLLNVSPKKINYILDQYTGVVGDILLPAMSVANERGFFEKAFTIDTDYSNRLSGDFYDRLQELTEKKNSVNGTVEDEVKYRWWNKKAGELSIINKEIKAIQADSSLSRKEKEEKLKILYGSKNAYILAAEDEYEQYMQTVDEIAASAALNDKDAADTIFRDTNLELFGAEVALQMHSKDAYEKAVKVCKERGLDMNTYYEVYFNDQVNNEQTFDLIENGLDLREAMEISGEIQAVDHEPGKKNVSYLQKYKAIAGANVSKKAKDTAMETLASDADRRRFAIGSEEDISLDLFVRIKENIEDLNELDGKQSANNARITAAIRHEDGLTDRQRAILWQLFSSSDSAKNNPFSATIGWEIVAKVKAYKTAEE